MLVEFVLLVVIAVGIFAFVLAPLLRPAAEEADVDQQPSVEVEETHEVVTADSHQPVRESS